METNLYEKGQSTSTPQKTKAPSRKRSWVWLVIGLILLSAIPLAGGGKELNLAAIPLIVNFAKDELQQLPEGLRLRKPLIASDVVVATTKCEK